MVATCPCNGKDHQLQRNAPFKSSRCTYKLPCSVGQPRSVAGAGSMRTNQYEALNKPLKPSAYSVIKRCSDLTRTPRLILIEGPCWAACVPAVEFLVLRSPLAIFPVKAPSLYNVLVEERHTRHESLREAAAAAAAAQPASTASGCQGGRVAINDLKAQPASWLTFRERCYYRRGSLRPTR